MVERINPGEGVNPAYFPEDPGKAPKRVEPTEPVPKDRKQNPDAVEISEEARKLLEEREGQEDDTANE